MNKLLDSRLSVIAVVVLIFSAMIHPLISFLVSFLILLIFFPVYLNQKSQKKILIDLFKKPLFQTLMFNSLMALIFIIITNQLLKSGFEETFLVSTFSYGLATVGGNVLIIKTSSHPKVFLSLMAGIVIIGILISFLFLRQAPLVIDPVFP